MKIKFIKEYVAVDPVPTSGIIHRYRFGETEEIKDYTAQWLIDNGFAEKVKESSWWKPGNGGRYYYVNNDSEIIEKVWLPFGSPADEKRFSIGNYFRNNVAAERYRDYLKAIATVRQDEGVIDLQGIGEMYETEDNKYDDFCVYTVAFDLYLRKLVVTDADEYISANAIWFDTEEHAQSSLDNHPDEWKIIVNYDWGRETEHVYKERDVESSNNGRGTNEN